MAKATTKSIGRDCDAEDLAETNLRAAGAMVRLLSEIGNHDPKDLRRALGTVSLILDRAEEGLKGMLWVLNRAFEENPITSAPEFKKVAGGELMENPYKGRHRMQPSDELCLTLTNLRGLISTLTDMSPDLNDEQFRACTNIALELCVEALAHAELVVDKPGGAQ